MSITLTYASSLLIPLEKLATCPSIEDVDRFIDTQLKFGQRDEHLLVIPAGGEPNATMLLLKDWESLGLKLTRKKQGKLCWNDLCLVDSGTGPTAPCDWLEWDAATSTVALRKGSIRPCQGTVVLAHGKESGPDGNKMMALAPLAEKRGFKVIRPDFKGMNDPDQRVGHLLDLTRGARGPLFLVGSSLGGYVVLKASQVLDTAGLFLMAPAIGIAGYPDQQPEPGCTNVCVVHAWQDEIIPVRTIIAWAKQYQAELHLVESDHRLTNKIDLLKALFREMLKRPGKQTTFICPTYNAYGFSDK